MKLKFESELQEIIDEYQEVLSRAKHSDASDVLSTLDVSALITRCVAAVERASGRQSQYSLRMTEILSRKYHSGDWSALGYAVGIVQALLNDLQKGFTNSIEELLHANVFSDFIEMAEHLVNNGYKDAAAVITGSTLEVHLKQLAAKFDIQPDRGGKPKKADTLNSELVKADAYSKLDQKSVTAWLGLRNDAAHGNYGEYNKSQVNLMIDSVRNFVSRNPA